MITLHAPAMDLDPVASALAGVDVYRAACCCGRYIGPPVDSRADLAEAFTTHVSGLLGTARAA